MEGINGNVIPAVTGFEHFGSQDLLITLQGSPRGSGACNNPSLCRGRGCCGGWGRAVPCKAAPSLASSVHWREPGMGSVRAPGWSEVARAAVTGCLWLSVISSAFLLSEPYPWFGNVCMAALRGPGQGLTALILQERAIWFLSHFDPAFTGKQISNMEKTYLIIINNSQEMALAPTYYS